MASQRDWENATTPRATLRACDARPAAAGETLCRSVGDRPQGRSGNACAAGGPARTGDIPSDETRRNAPEARIAVRRNAPEANGARRNAPEAGDPRIAPQPPLAPEATHSTAAADRTFAELGERRRRKRKGGLLEDWQWAQDVKAACDEWLAEAEGGLPAGQGWAVRLTVPEIIVRLGPNEDDQPYKDWEVRRALKAARLFRQPPATLAEQRALKRCLGSHPDPATKTPEQLRREAARKAVRGLEQAMGLGYPLDELCDLVRAALGHRVEIRICSEAVFGTSCGIRASAGGPGEGRP